MNYACYRLTTILTSKIIKETIENRLQIHLDKPYNYLRYYYEKYAFVPVVPLLNIQGIMPSLSGIRA